MLSILLHAQLAKAMWEALICCMGDGGAQLQGSALLDLCGDATTSSLLARHLLSAHMTVQVLPMPDKERVQAVRKTLALQESFARSYCGLYRPDALWTVDGPGDAGIAALQEALNSHILSLGASAVQLGVLVAFVDAVDFHISWAASGAVEGICPVPLALPVLLFRLVCTILSSSMSTEEAGTVRRHFLLLAPAFLAVCEAFVELAVARLTAKETTDDVLLASQAMLDSVIATLAAGASTAATLGPFNALITVAVAQRLLACEPAAADPALLARLSLVFLQLQAAPEVGPESEATASQIRSHCLALPEESKVSFWQQIRARTRLLAQPAEDVLTAVEAWLGEAHPEALSDSVSQEDVPVAQLDLLVERCLEQLPESLRPAPSSAVQELPDPPQAPMAALAAFEEAAASSKAAEGEGFVEEVSNFLSVTNLPALPGQSGDKPKKVKASQRLARNDVSRIRGVDPLQAPEDLRCAIDGKLLGVPLRSPYGHSFERDTLEQWIRSCGSVCPITGQALRLEDCEEDAETERKVFEWVKTAKAAHKRKVEEKRSRRAAKEAESGHDSVLVA